MQRADLLEKNLMLGKTEGRRRRGQQRMKWLDHRLNGHEFEQTPGDSEGQESLGVLQSMGFQRAGHDLAIGQQNNYTNRTHVCPAPTLRNRVLPVT